MGILKQSSLLFLFLSVSCFAILATANFAEFDDYWQTRAHAAFKIANASYHPFPDEVRDEINHHVHLATKGMVGSNSTRRNLGKYTGPCIATNPIDRCWRCRADWATNRKSLARCALGFGRKTTGGLKGRYYMVTDSSDEVQYLARPKPGTLRYAVTRNESLWIVFSRNMVIELSQELIMTSDKTIDGRGHTIHIAFGAGITVQYVNNVIIHGLHIHHVVPKEGGDIANYADHSGFRTRSDGDGISIFGSTNVWVDHVSMSNCFDGLIDVIQASTAITISNSQFTHHNEVMLFGASGKFKEDTIMQVTVAFNRFGRGLIQRMPRCRWGYVHVVNNDYTYWSMYAIGGSEQPTIISQGNRFIAPNSLSAKNVTKRDYAEEWEWKKWQWRSEGDLFMNDAFFVESGPPLSATQSKSRFDMVKAKPGTYVTRLTRNAGALACVVNKPC